MIICEFWDVFQNTSFTEPLGETAILCTSRRYSKKPPDTVKNYFTGAFQAFYARSRSSHSKAFIYLKSLKTVCEEVNLMKLRDANLQLYEKKLFHASSLLYFAFIFSKYIMITSSEEALKVWEHNFFLEI